MLSLVKQSSRVARQGETTPTGTYSVFQVFSMELPSSDGFDFHVMPLVHLVKLSVFFHQPDSPPLT